MPVLISRLMTKSLTWSAQKVLDVALLKPYFSSMTMVLCQEKGIMAREAREESRITANRWRTGSAWGKSPEKAAYTLKASRIISTIKEAVDEMMPRRDFSA